LSKNSRQREAFRIRPLYSQFVVAALVYTHGYEHQKYGALGRLRMYLYPPFQCHDHFASASLLSLCQCFLSSLDHQKGRIVPLCEDCLDDSSLLVWWQYNGKIRRKQRLQRGLCRVMRYRYLSEAGSDCEACSVQEQLFDCWTEVWKSPSIPCKLAARFWVLEQRINSTQRNSDPLPHCLLVLLRSRKSLHHRSGGTCPWR